MCRMHRRHQLRSRLRSTNMKRIKEPMISSLTIDMAAATLSDIPQRYNLIGFITRIGESQTRGQFPRATYTHSLLATNAAH
jgi:hypothetical protein